MFSSSTSMQDVKIDWLGNNFAISFNPLFEQIAGIKRILFESTPNSFNLIKVSIVADFVVICSE